MLVGRLGLRRVMLQFISHVLLLRTALNIENFTSDSPTSSVSTTMIIINHYSDASLSINLFAYFNAL